MKHMTQYFLFGSDAVGIFSVNNDVQDVIDAYENSEVSYQVFEFNPLETTGWTLLSEFNGWRDFAIITQEEYNKLI
jgi:hypothetical protein